MPYNLIVLGFHTYSSTFFGMVPRVGIFSSGHLFLFDADNIIFLVIVSLANVHREIGA
jgi:hypothetical protein